MNCIHQDLGLQGRWGLSRIGLFFFGHLVAGFAGYETLLFLLLVFYYNSRVFLPGGISGILGAAAIIFSIILAGGNIVQMSIAVLIAFNSSNNRNGDYYEVLW